MNTENLHTLIERYIDKYDFLIADPQNELFKWETAKKFHKVWTDPQLAGHSVDQLFEKVRKEMSVLVDGSMVTPASGIIKMSKEKGVEITRLFRDILYADDGGDLSLRQHNMDTFLEEIDKIRAELFPQSFKFKQDRHSVSCYLALLRPEKDYIYRYTDANEFAKRIEFGFDIGSGASFRLDNYYKMCDSIVDALREYPDFLAKHFGILEASPDIYYYDKSLHLMVYDLMYCCREYNLYDGIVFEKQIRPAPNSLPTIDTAEIIQKYITLAKELNLVENRISEIEQISLLGVQARHKNYGVGFVSFHKGNIVGIRFGEIEKRFVIHKQYILLPVFEDNDRIVEIFTEYDELCKKRDALRVSINRIGYDYRKVQDEVDWRGGAIFSYPKDYFAEHSAEELGISEAARRELMDMQILKPHYIRSDEMQEIRLENFREILRRGIEKKKGQST